jgi:hypothetical protein
LKFVAQIITYVSLCLSAAHADTPHLSNINKGNLAVGGSSGLVYNSLGGFAFSLAPRAQFFFADHLSLGGLLSYSTNQLYSYLGVGPAGTYYFLSDGRCAAFISSDVYINNIGSPPTVIIGDLGVGALWFFAPSVGFGPSVNYSHTFSNQYYSSFDSVNLLFNFSIYL